MNGRDRHSGFTLVELLIVIAIILLVSSVTVPTMMRSGMFGGNPSAGAARDLFALLRASQVYATTHNVDAAIAYGIDAPQDSLYTGTGGTANDSAPVGIVPQGYFDYAFPDLAVPLDDTSHRTENAVLNSSMLIRRITIGELNQRVNDESLASAIILEFEATEWDNGNGVGVKSYDDTKDVFVPVGTRFGTFQEFPSETCVLINDPAFQPTLTEPDGTLAEDLGLQGVYIIRYSIVFDSSLDAFVYDVERVFPRKFNTDIVDNIVPERGLPPALDFYWKNKFPAHVFKKTGGLDTALDSKQRITLSMGLLPDADYYDRYMVDDEDMLYLDGDYRILENPDVTDSVYNQLVGLDTDIRIFVATGRVKVAQDDE